MRKQPAGHAMLFGLDFNTADKPNLKTNSEEIKLYNQSRGDLTFVIQSRDSEQLAKLTYAENAVNYHKLLL